MRKGGIRVRLQRQPLAILLALVESPGNLVSRGELRQKIWSSGTHVSFEQGLNSATNRLRDALCDSAEAPRYIETVPGEGYRFIAQVKRFEAPWVSSEEMLRSQVAAGQLRAGARWPLIGGTIAAALLLATGLLAVRGGWLASRDVAFRARDWVLLTNFENRTQEPVLDGTLEYALERELSNSQFVNVVPRERVEDALRLMKRPRDSKIDAAVGREICLRDGGIRVLVKGRVEKLGAAYVLSAELVDPVRGVVLASLTEEDLNDSQLPTAVRRLSNRVRQKLGEEAELVQQNGQQMEKVTTPSLRAAQLYTQADDLIRAGDNGTAASVLEVALKEDPDFASGHLLLGYAYDNVGEKIKARPHFQRAFELAESSSDRERLFIAATYDEMVLRDPDKSYEAYEGLLRLYPDDYWGTNNLIFLYKRAGRLDQVAPLEVRMADLRPNDVELNARAAWVKATGENNWEGARRYLARASSLIAAEGENPNTDQQLRTWVWLFPAFADWTANKLAVAHAELVQIETANSLDPVDLAFFHLAFGELAVAENTCLRERNSRAGEECLAIVAFARGDLQGVKAHLQRAESKPGDGIPAGSTASLLLVRVGLVSDAEHILHRERPPTDPRLLEGEIALGRGETVKGVSLLEEGLEFGRTRVSLPYFVAAESLARLYEKEGKLEDALRILRNASEQKVQSYRDPMVGTGMVAGYWLIAELDMADLYRKMGRAAEAEKLEAGLLKMLAYADADHPILRELQKRQRLVASVQRSAQPNP